jgi:hypothetical protein
MLTDLNNIYTIKYNATVIIMVISQFCMNATMKETGEPEENH